MKYSSIYLFLSILICVIMTYILFFTDKTEGFENKKPSTPTLSFCPFSSEPYYASNGDILCCEGKVEGNTCKRPGCALNNASSHNMRDCGEIYSEIMTFVKSYCPKSMPNVYFEEDKSKSNTSDERIKFYCTSGKVSDDNTKLLTKIKDNEKCIIGNNYFNNKNSCEHVKSLENINCYGKDCEKSIEQISDNSNPLIRVSFTDENGQRHTGYTKSHYANYIYSQTGKPMNIIESELENNIMLAETQKALYIDKTLNKNDVKM
jgi:hypothetical protein